MVRLCFCLVILAILAVACSRKGEQTASATNEETLPAGVYYPADYRSWTHVKSMILEEGHALYESFGGIHHVYANEKALEGYRNQNFPDGSVIVFDLLEANRADHAVTEGNRKVIGIMYKNAAAFPQTGGWGFGAFKNQQGEKVEIDPVAGCFNCHASQKDRDYVFSSFRE